MSAKGQRELIKRGPVPLRSPSRSNSKAVSLGYPLMTTRSGTRSSLDLRNEGND